MLELKDFNKNLQVSLSKKIIILGELHNLPYRNKVYKAIEQVYKHNSQIVILAEGIPINLRITKAYDYYKEHITNGHFGYGWDCDVLDFAKKYGIPVVGMNLPKTLPDYKVAIQKDDEASKAKGFKVYVETFKLREHYMCQVMHSLSKVQTTCIVGDTHLRTIKTPELGEASYIIRDGYVRENGIVFRADANSREIN